MTQVAPIETTPATPVLPEAPKPPMVTVKLSRNYRPAGDFEIVGHWKDEIKVKNAAGQEVVVQKREFIRDEVAPPKLAGTGFADKLWAGTVLKVAKDEARHIRTHDIGTLEVEDD